MPVSSGSYTVGASGAYYASWFDAFQDIASPLTGNMSLTQIDNTDEAFDNSWVINIDTYDFIMDSNDPHNGVIGAGHIINVRGSKFPSVSLSGTGTFACRNLQFKKSSTHAPTSGTRALRLLLHGMTSAADSVEIRDLIFDNNDLTGNMQFYCRTTANGANIYNILHRGYAGVSAADRQVFLQMSSTPNCKFRNITVDSRAAAGPAFHIEGVSSASSYIKNCIAMVNSGVAFIHSGSGVLADRMENCASTDTSAVGPGAITNFTPATEFVSLNVLDTDYLIPAFTSQFKEAGASVDQTSDMRGTAYGASPPIGAYVASAIDPGGGSSETKVLAKSIGLPLTGALS